MHLIPWTRYTNKVIILFSEIYYTKCTCGFRVYQIWKLICSAKFVWLITEFAWFIHVSLLEIKCLAPEFGNCCGWMIVRVFHRFGGDEWHDFSFYDARFLSAQRRTIYGESDLSPWRRGAHRALSLWALFGIFVVKREENMRTNCSQTGSAFDNIAIKISINEYTSINICYYLWNHSKVSGQL